MAGIFDWYNSVSAQLAAYDKQLREAYATINSFDSQLADCIKQLQQGLDDGMAQNQKIAARLKAYINIAKNHTGLLREPTAPMAPDLARLSKLAVLISSISANDPYAAQLYTEAMAQLMYFEQIEKTAGARVASSISDMERELKQQKAQAEGTIRAVREKVRAYLRSEDFVRLINHLELVRRIYAGPTKVAVNDCLIMISPGDMMLRCPAPPGMEQELAAASKGYCDTRIGAMAMPANIPAFEGPIYMAEYSSADAASEAVAMGGIQTILLNYVKYYSDKISKAVFFDPVHFNSGLLGCLAPLCGVNKFFDPTPTSGDELRARLKAVIDDVGRREARGEFGEKSPDTHRLLVFHNFPNGYDSASIGYIRRLCVNAKRCGMIILLTQDIAATSKHSEEAVEFVRSMANCIRMEGKAHYLAFPGSRNKIGFRWYPAPKYLEDSVANTARSVPPTLGNDYLQRVGLSKLPAYRKGYRALNRIPYGVAPNGELLYVDFCDSNFANFICGASRSGKSTLLHTIITGLIRNTHPDDLELWLIDFKMTEFSRYTEHLPPHVRYILLDESPELVYDIIDRLTEIMTARQNMFKGKWDKLSQVPGDKYMPAIMVVIDEFSVMSKILADTRGTKENYAHKLQLLLAKGGALGLHFIFASQNFTDGTQGLTDTSKKQIQQRIAMKTQVSEIKATLDLGSASDDDKDIMEQLPVHHALLKAAPDENGSRLVFSKVLYISDQKAQTDYIDAMAASMTPQAKFAPNDPSGYIWKRPLIVDGNAFTSFDAKQEEMRALLNGRNPLDADATLLFVGEPRRMHPHIPVAVGDEYGENIVVVAPQSERAPACSIAMSMAASLQMQNVGFEAWGSIKNGLCRSFVFAFPDAPSAMGIDDVSRAVGALKKKITAKIPGNMFCFLFGFESMLMELAETSTKFEEDTSQNMSSDAWDVDRMKALLANPAARPGGSAVSEGNCAEDLKYILANGPRLGYHFVMFWPTVGELKLSKLNTGLFRHKLLFRTVKTDVMELFGSAAAVNIDEMDAHTFRYSDGLDTASYRPYLHPGLEWDGWKLCDGKAVNITDETENYLL